MIVVSSAFTAEAIGAVKITAARLASINFRILFSVWAPFWRSIIIFHVGSCSIEIRDGHEHRVCNSPSAFILLQCEKLILAVHMDLMLVVGLEDQPHKRHDFVREAL
jgi:hypothetical protein